MQQESGIIEGWHGMAIFWPGLHLMYNLWKKQGFVCKALER